ncbi:hypothetical protein ACLI09_08650 [Flavobacterium sp. RHBU_24]|uniref:hypothetical protein n=1 Tax=Flavobacterium sp. RHBU_24 TaxID=3391185 RepID=UPI0039851DF9
MFRLILCYLLGLSSISYSQDTIDSTDYNYCKDVYSVKDKCDGVTRTYSSDLRSVQFVRLKNTVYMSITVWASSYNLNEKGVIILLTENKRIVKPNVKVEIEEFSDGQYSHHVFFPLSQDDVAKLKKYHITDYRLDDFDDNLDERDGEIYCGYMNCIAPKVVATKSKVPVKKKMKS